MTGDTPTLDALTEQFMAYLKQRFAQRVVVGDGATDVLRQPLFPGLEAPPRELAQMQQMQEPMLDPGMLGVPDEEGLYEPFPMDASLESW